MTCRRRIGVLGGILVLCLATHAQADLTGPTGHALTAGLVAGMVSHQDAGNSLLLDGELGWTFFPSEFASGLLTPGAVIDAGVELAPTRARLTVAAKLGIVYLLSAEAGIAIRSDANDADIGASGRLRLNVPIGKRIYLSPYLRSSAFRSGARDSELGLGIKLLLWGSSSKLEGALNH